MEPKDDLEEIAENAGRYARKMFNETPQVGAAADHIVEAIKAEPVKSAFIALGVGALIGVLLGRR